MSKLIRRAVVVGEGSGTEGQGEDPLYLTEHAVWSEIIDAVNAANEELQTEYEYIAHYMEQEVTIPPKDGSRQYFFDWVLNVVMQRK